VKPDQHAREREQNRHVAEEVEHLVFLREGIVGHHRAVQDARQDREVEQDRMPLRVARRHQQADTEREVDGDDHPLVGSVHRRVRPAKAARPEVEHEWQEQRENGPATTITMRR
jgi:hypothetical protein